MVRATLDDLKTMTRRVANPQPIERAGGWYWKGGRALQAAGYGARYVHSNWTAVEEAMLKVCPYGQVGDRLWVRETWRCFGGREYEYQKSASSIRYRADEEQEGPDYGLSAEWRPSIFMPRWVSRLTLEIVSVRVERVQDITEDNAKAEGVENCSEIEPQVNRIYQRNFAVLWNLINAKRGFGWDMNPFVWVIEFKRIKPVSVPHYPLGIRTGNVFRDAMAENRGIHINQ
jgi:hypothetical protein